VTKHTPEQIRDVSERIYRKKLDSECGDGTAKMTDDGIANGIMSPNGKPKISIRNRAGAYDRLTRLYLEELGIEPPA
jgi:hypothetical protein